MPISPAPRPQSSQPISKAVRVSQQKEILAALNDTQKLRILDPCEQVYVTHLSTKRDSVLMELLTVKVTSYLGWGTRYCSELNVKIRIPKSKT